MYCCTVEKVAWGHKVLTLFLYSVAPNLRQTRRITTRSVDGSSCGLVLSQLVQLVRFPVHGCGLWVLLLAKSAGSGGEGSRRVWSSGGWTPGASTRLCRARGLQTPPAMPGAFVHDFQSTTVRPKQRRRAIWETERQASPAEVGEVLPYVYGLYGGRMSPELVAQVKCGGVSQPRAATHLGFRPPLLP